MRTRSTDRTLIVSDLHLGPGGPYDIFAGADALPAMLDALADRPTQVVINGDGLDFLLDDLPIDRLDTARAAGQARAIVDHHRDVFAALRRVDERGGEVVFRLGNHDPELALPEVQDVIETAVGEPRFHRGDQPDVIAMGHARILVTHGEHTDWANRLAYRHLPDPESGSTGHRFRYPAGSRLVKRALNPLKAAGHRFADLVKPDVSGGVLAVAQIGGEATSRVLSDAGLDVIGALARARVTTRRTFDGADELAAVQQAADEVSDMKPGTPGWFARLLTGCAAHAGSAGAIRRRASKASASFFDLTPEPAEWRECRRLQSIFRVGAVLMGHTHAARFGVDGDLLHLNTGTWIPLVRLPAADDIDGWARFIDELRNDPGMVGAAAHRLQTRFTAALVEPTTHSATISLVEWADGALRVVEQHGMPCRSEVAAVPQKPRVGRAGERIRPLMVGADGHRHAPDGFDAAQGNAPARVDASLGDGMLASAAGDKHDLALQRWGLVVPAGRTAWAREALAPLIALRADEMGHAVPVLEWPGATSDDEAVDAEDWVLADWLDGFAESERPAYVLIVGDFAEVPRAVGRALVDEGAFVGRLAFDEDADYARYAQKVVRWDHGRKAAGPPHLGLFAARDGSEAMTVAQVALVDPLRDALAADDHFDDIAELDTRCWSGTVDDLLSDPLVSGPNLLLTVGHGIGPPAGGWVDADEQRARQGALSLGGDAMEAADLRQGRFLPGGIWFTLACFSAGTPTTSDFAHWLDEIDGAALEDVRAVLAGLSPVPFVARPPMAALANPNGPLAVVGHVDLAWTHGFDHPRYRGQKAHQRFVDFARELGRAEGRHGRVGYAAWRLWNAAKRFESSVARAHDRAKRRGQPPPPAGAHWLARHDLASYVVLGDPAVTLPGPVPQLSWDEPKGSSIPNGEEIEPHLPRAEIERVVDIAIELDLVAPDRRGLLMDGIDRRMWRAIPTAADPIGQTRADLAALNRHPVPDLLATWLENAARFAEPRAVAAELWAICREERGRLRCNPETQAGQGPE